jgi:glycosyltransferase involved in cell wall biosynthesis
MDNFARLSPRLRVLHVGKYYAPHVGGMESHVQTLCSELRKYVDARVLVANAGREDREEIAGSVPVMRVRTFVRLAGAPVCPSMSQKIRQSGADLVHIHLPNPTAALAFIVSGFQGPLVLTWHSDIIRQRFLKVLFMPIERRLLRDARAIIASSPDYVAYSPNLYEHRLRCRIIPFGIPLAREKQSDAAQVSMIHRLYGRPLLLSIGRLVGYKGYRYLVRAMKYIDAHLLLIGEGPERLKLEGEVRSIGLSERVHFLGRVEETAPYYQACDIFVLPSIGRNEAFGIVQLEAMACGKPVVNTQLRSGVPFVSVNGFTGVTVPPADSLALARAINVLLDDPDRRSAYGAAAETRVKREFSLEKMVSETLRVYEEVIRGDQNPSYAETHPAFAAD